MPPQSLPCALIVTAIPLEANAVAQFLEDLQEVRHPKGSLYMVGRLDTPPTSWKVALVQTGAGNASAAHVTERAMGYFHPAVALFVGVAGGRKDVRVGDVVVADKVYGYESGKDTDEGLLARPEAFVPSYELMQSALSKSTHERWLLRLQARLPASVPRIFIKPIASGEKLIASSRAEIATLLARSYGDAIAVEMEGYGFLKAVHANPGVKALVIRGISDLLDDKGKKSDAEDQAMAATHAAALAMELLLVLQQ